MWSETICAEDVMSILYTFDGFFASVTVPWAEMLFAFRLHEVPPLSTS